MRTTISVSILGAALTVLAGCTVKEIDQPALAGPSTLATSITMRASPDTLVQDGASQSVITITAVDPEGRPRNIPLRADISIDGVVQDFGRLSTKQPVANGQPLIYTAPASSTLAAGQVPSTVTILITPTDGVAFDGRGEFSRQVDIRLMPQGIILPTNPNLAAAFTVTPASPQVLDTVTFDASTTTNGVGTVCNTACTYAWNFGDGTTGTGQTTTHQYRSINTFTVTLTVTDARGASAVATRPVTVSPGTPPSAIFTSSPANPGVEQDVFFNASQSTPAAGRTITKYEWSFGDGTTGTGSVTSHRYSAPGSYLVQLTTTDDAGSVGRSSPTTLVVGTPVGPTPTATLTQTGSPSAARQPASFNASGSRPGTGANITRYVFNYGDGSPEEVTTNPLQTHVYFTAGTYVATVTVTDSLGRTASAQVQVTVAP